MDSIGARWALSGQTIGTYLGPTEEQLGYMLPQTPGYNEVHQLKIMIRVFSIAVHETEVHAYASDHSCYFLVNNFLAA